MRRDLRHSRQAGQRSERLLHAEVVSARLERLESMEVTLGEVAEVVLRGPGKGNALGPAFWEEAPEVARALDADAAVRAVVLRGHGDHFSYGLDLPAMMGQLAPLVAPEGGAEARRGLLDQLGRMQAACEAWALCKKPIVASVHGWCIGGAIALLTASDVRLCSRDARFSVREARLAIAPDLGTLQRLPAIVGEGHARQLALTAEDFDAVRAERIGLVNAVCETPEALLAEARRIAGQIAANAPLAVQGIKQVMEARLAPTVGPGLRLSALWSASFLPSEDFGEAAAAFLERRPPRFTGK